MIVGLFKDLTYGFSFLTAKAKEKVKIKNMFPFHFTKYKSKDIEIWQSEILILKQEWKWC